ncbi:hypothetical protein [Stutzerimonas balearica]|uniref:hypothetical protein n=1 Tax=Stutzerimonas balearica TaxID=74829 RepID=UPI0028AD3356|nr:hypothetical protein [Stutzerimonas balearica]
MSSFAQAKTRLHAAVLARLADGPADYVSPAGERVACGVRVLVDRNLQQQGPEGIFLSDAVGISWCSAELQAVERGGVFIHAGQRYLLEQPISDDGQMPTWACMEQR